MVDASQLDIAVSRLIDARAGCWIVGKHSKLFAGTIKGFKSDPPEEFPYLTSKCSQLAKMEEVRLKYTPTETNLTVFVSLLYDFSLLHELVLKNNPGEKFSVVVGDASLIIYDAWLKAVSWSIDSKNSANPALVNADVELKIFHLSEIVFSKKDASHANAK